MREAGADKFFGVSRDWGLSREGDACSAQHGALVQDLLLGLALPEGPRPEQHLEEDDAQRPHIDFGGYARGGGAHYEALGGKVPVRARALRGQLQRGTVARPVHDLGKPKVRDFDVTLLVEKDVTRLEVVVNNSLPPVRPLPRGSVQVPQPGQNLHRDGTRIPLWDYLLRLHQVVQIRSLSYRPRSQPEIR